MFFLSNVGSNQLHFSALFYVSVFSLFLSFLLFYFNRLVHWTKKSISSALPYACMWSQFVWQHTCVSYALFECNSWMIAENFEFWMKTWKRKYQNNNMENCFANEYIYIILYIHDNENYYINTYSSSLRNWPIQMSMIYKKKWYLSSCSSFNSFFLAKKNHLSFICCEQNLIVSPFGNSCVWSSLTSSIMWV